VKHEKHSIFRFHRLSIDARGAIEFLFDSYGALTHLPAADIDRDDFLLGALAFVTAVASQFEHGLLRHFRD
jgi:hypothetical protein